MIEAVPFEHLPDEFGPVCRQAVVQLAGCFVRLNGCGQIAEDQAGIHAVGQRNDGQAGVVIAIHHGPIDRGSPTVLRE